MGPGLLGALSMLIAPGDLPAQGLTLPRGLQITNELEYAWSRVSEEPILESWTTANFASGGFAAGLQLVSFQPPDPSVSAQNRSHFAVSRRFVQASSAGSVLRAGHTYAIFGQGLALNAYEERDLRVDQNLEGVYVRGTRGDMTARLLSGTTVFGSSEDIDRARGDRLHAADLEIAPSSIGLVVGGSAVRLQRDGARPQNLYAARASAYPGPFYLHGEYAGVRRPGETGHGLYLQATLGVGPLDLTAEYKDYERLELRNSGNVPYNLPPALVREHTYTLLNRHPHALDPDDERGALVEATLTAGDHQLVGHYSTTRNQDERDEFNFFDEVYGELDLELGARFGLDAITLITAVDHQKSFASGLTPDPFRRLLTNVHELRVIVNETHAARLQFEHQHNESEIDGKYDSWLGLLEWTRWPALVVNVVAETSNRSSAQREPGEAVEGLYATASYEISEHHNVSVLYGRRLAGFVCVGGVCRLEPEFDGIEFRLLSRF